MYKENLFELIRNEEVIIWAGAGLSLYAGYPSGQRLGEILVENLSQQERRNINENLPLPDLAEEFFRLKGNNRNALIKILKQTFLDKEPTSTICHQNLANIPHFKTIITTNYDSLIENAFKQKGQIAFSRKHIPYLQNGKTHIFKAHGDLNEPDSIIITKSDYNNFFKTNSDNDVYWTVIRERLTTNNVLFLGYNIEDPNVSVIFDKITDALGQNRKECFLVAPNLPQHKINDLIKKGIHYLNTTAEDLISDLLQNLKDNIIDDIEKGKTSADTFRHFLSNIDLLPELKAEKDSFKVRSIRGTGENVGGTMTIKLKNDSNFIREFTAFATGEKFGTFEIPEDKLLDVDFSYGGLKFPHSEGATKLEFKSYPRVDTTIDIRFDNNFEMNDVPVKLYGSTSRLEIHVELSSARITVNLNLNVLPNVKVKFNYQHKKTCKNVKSEIELYTLLKNLGEGNMFTVYTKSGEKYTKSFENMKPLIGEANFLLDYFNKLKTIEQYFNVHFSDVEFDSIDDSTVDKIELMMSVIKGEKIKYIWNDELLMTLIENYPDEIVKQFEQVDEINTPVVTNYNVEEIIELHGQDINVGFKKIEFPNPFIVNLQSIIDRKENVVRIKSKSKEMIVSYSKTKIEE